MFINKIKNEIIYFTKLLYEKGYTTGSEGNISYKISETKILITSSGIIKSKIKKEDLIIIDLNGNPIKNNNKNPSSERFSHIQIYKERQDVNAIVHAHPIYTIIQTLNINFFENIWLPEAKIFLKNPKILPTAMPATKEGAEVIRGNCLNTNTLIIQNHGSFTFSDSLEDAFNILEILEKYCKIDFLLKKI